MTTAKKTTKKRTAKAKPAKAKVSDVSENTTEDPKENEDPEDLGDKTPASEKPVETTTLISEVYDNLVAASSALETLIFQYSRQRKSVTRLSGARRQVKQAVKYLTPIAR